MSQRGIGDGLHRVWRTIGTLWEALRASYWFIPALMVTLAAAAAFIMTEVDRRFGGEWVHEFPWLYRGGADGAREVLSTTATAMLGVAGVTFSITIVALTLAANQFGPRLLRTFMRDRGSQAALGTFIATFLYCLLVLRSVHGENDDLDRFVPHLSVSLAVVFAVVSLGVLIYFIHHIAANIQAPNVVAAVSAELNHAIDHLYPEEIGQDLTDQAAKLEALRRQQPPEIFDGGCSIASKQDGYVQRIDDEGLLRHAKTHDLLISVRARPSRFVAAGDPVLSVWTPDDLDDDLRRKLRACVVLGPQRSLTQDVLFPTDQLAEMAVRALSPSTNDPYTAAQCVQRLSVALAKFASRALPPAYRGDDQGRLRVVAYPVGFGEALDAAFDPIRDHANGSPMIMLRMTEALERLRGHVNRPEDLGAVMEHARALVHEVRAKCRAAGDDCTRGQIRRCRDRLDALLASL